MGSDAVRKHLKTQVPVSQIADEMNVQPTMIHNWINSALQQIERSFESPRSAKSEFKARVGLPKIHSLAALASEFWVPKLVFDLVIKYLSAGTRCGLPSLRFCICDD